MSVGKRKFGCMYNVLIGFGFAYFYLFILFIFYF
jgi:hypothetical protein